jgi:hypothetical protein
MRRADIVRKGKLSFTKDVVPFLCSEAYSGIALILTSAGGVFSLFGVAMLLCGWPIAFFMLWREFKLDIKALDDPNDNPRANRLIANRRERGSFDTQIALLGALLLLLFSSAAYLHGRWPAVASIAAVIFVISVVLIVRRALMLIRSANF